jgi:hypothetical protein
MRHAISSESGQAGVCVIVPTSLTMQSVQNLAFRLAGLLNLNADN